MSLSHCIHQTLNSKASTRFHSGFFFSSRRRHTSWTGDWSSDVCSSDLPHRGAAAPTLICKKTPSGGNITVEGNIAETAENRATRVWATGTGTPPDQLIVYDQDPGVDTADVLLTETVTNYSTTSVVATLADDAQQERAFRSVLTNTMQVRAYHKDLDPATYHTGDRAQLIYQDEGVDINLPAVRIVDIEISVNTQNAADSSLITLDLSDAQLPDTGLVT